MIRNMTDATVVSAAREQVSAPLAGEVVVLNLRTGHYFGLDLLGRRIWDMLQAPRPVAEIRDTLLREYDVERERCTQDLIALLCEMEAEGVIEVRDAEGG